jgi:hypothetical protein
MSSFQIVNGYVCFDCADVALAKKGVNPAHPPSSPNAQSNPSASTQASSNTQSTPAVTFGGSLSQTQGAAAVQPTTSAGATGTTLQPPPPQGAQLNIVA